MKTIKYRGELITFKIPENWLEEYEETGGGTFYEDIPSSGTLRVNVMTIENKAENGNPSFIFKNKSETHDLKAYLTQNGDEIFEYLDRSQENNLPISMYTFACIHKTKQIDFLIAVFTWTIETKFEKSQSYIQELDLIRESIKNIEFGR
jgi:hypothetical protein